MLEFFSEQFYSIIENFNLFINLSIFTAKSIPNNYHIFIN